MKGDKKMFPLCVLYVNSKGYRESRRRKLHMASRLLSDTREREKDQYHGQGNANPKIGTLTHASTI